MFSRGSRMDNIEPIIVGRNLLTYLQKDLFLNDKICPDLNSK